MQATRLGMVIAWALATAALVANIAGYALHLYRAAWWFDRALHAGTLLALTFVAAVALFARGLDARHRILAFVLLAAFGVASGALWELAEWLYDMLQPADVIKGKRDTMLDLVMDTVGSLIAAAAVQATLVETAPRPPEPTARSL